MKLLINIIKYEILLIKIIKNKNFYYMVRNLICNQQDLWKNTHFTLKREGICMFRAKNKRIQKKIAIRNWV